MTRKKTIITATIIFCVLAAGASAFYFFKFKVETRLIASLRADKNQIQSEKNYFEINDELAGVSFKIGKKFERMPARDLQVKNTSFIYGFSAMDDKTVACYISQTQRENSGVVKVADLRDGVFEQVKKSFPDAKIDSAEIIDVGENNNKGIKLKMNYTEENKFMIQWEAVGITDKVANFAFCVSPKAVVDLYKEDIDLFLGSLRIRN